MRPYGAGGGPWARPEHTSIIAKLDVAGEIIWSKPITDAVARRVCIDDASNIAALIDGNSRTPYPGWNAVKLSADGQQLKALGSPRP